MTEPTKNWVDYIGARRAVEHGVPKAFGMGFDEIKSGINVFDKATEGKRLVAFGRVAGVGAGLAIASGALRSRDENGYERPLLARVGDLVIGGGIAAGSMVARW